MHLSKRWYVIYSGEVSIAETFKITEVTLGVWGVVTGVVQLILSAALLWSVAHFWWKIRSILGGRECVAVIAALVWTAFAVPGGVLLAMSGIVEIFT